MGLPSTRAGIRPSAAAEIGKNAKLPPCAPPCAAELPAASPDHGRGPLSAAPRATKLGAVSLSRGRSLLGTPCQSAFCARGLRRWWASACGQEGDTVSAWATHPGARGWNPERISSRMAFSCVSPSRRSRWTAEISDTSAADSTRALRLVNVPTARPVRRPAARAMCGTSLGPNSCEPGRRVASGAAETVAQQQQGGETAAGAGTHHHCRPQDDDDLCVADHYMAARPCRAPGCPQLDTRGADNSP